MFARHFIGQTDEMREQFTRCLQYVLRSPTFEIDVLENGLEESIRLQKRL